MLTCADMAGLSPTAVHSNLLAVICIISGQLENAHPIINGPRGLRGTKLTPTSL